jgi:hypothetical protein
MQFFWGLVFPSITSSGVKLTTNKKRRKAKHSYEKLGFEASHEGMKLYLRKTL